MAILGRVLALLVCVAALPLHVVLCMLIRLADGQPAIYRSERLGRHGKPFTMFKYRTMQVGCPPLTQSGFKLIVRETDARVTPLGRFLRCGIDELPQLWNVVRGEMAWVGPRPDESSMAGNYGPCSQQRLDIPPGITGLAQVLDSRHLSTAAGYAIDVWYRRQARALYDLWIVGVTPLFVLGWRSPGKRRLERLMDAPEFVRLASVCQVELDEAEARIMAPDAGAD